MSWRRFTSVDYEHNDWNMTDCSQREKEKEDQQQVSRKSLVFRLPAEIDPRVQGRDYRDAGVDVDEETM